MQSDACRRASYELAGCAEEVHKILRGLSTGDFPPAMSVEVFSQTVIGGLSSALGAVRASWVCGRRPTG